MLTDEDITIAKLKGYTCLLKFKDGEELLLKIDLGDNSAVWFCDAEDSININSISPFPYPDIAVDKTLIKYIIKI